MKEHTVHMKKVSLILCIIMVLSLLAGCELPETKPIRLGAPLTLNQFWNGVLSDADATVYDQTDNPERFSRMGYKEAVECVAIKDYNVYMLYDFGTAATMSDYLLSMLESWDKYDADVECVPTATGIYYIMRGSADNCNVCYVSDRTMIIGLGNHKDEQEMRSTINDMINSADTEYDASRIQTLPLVQRDIKK